MGVNSLPKTVTRQRHGCDLNPGPSVPESSTLTTRLPSHPVTTEMKIRKQDIRVVSLLPLGPYIALSVFHQFPSLILFSPLNSAKRSGEAL